MHILQVTENALVLLLLSEMSFYMFLTADAGKDSRQQGQRGTMVQLVDCKDELSMAMLKVITVACSKNIVDALIVIEIMMGVWHLTSYT